jgi:hypothetical protein
MNRLFQYTVFVLYISFIIRFVAFCLKELFHRHIFCYFVPRRKRPKRDDNSPAPGAKG